MTGVVRLALTYLALLSLTAIILTVYDKFAARMKKLRVPEISLLAVAILGGAGAMLLTMLVIHHKTKHMKFMVGLPVILLFHLFLIFALMRDTTLSTILF